MGGVVFYLKGSLRRECLKLKFQHCAYAGGESVHYQGVRPVLYRHGESFGFSTTVQTCPMETRDYAI